MAKPTLDSLRPAASSSTSTRRLNPSPSVSSHPLNRCPRSRPARSHILPLLAALSAVPLSIHAYPLDPTQTSLPFLYPPFLYQPTPLAKRSVPPSTPDAATPTTSSPPAPSYGCQYDKGNLPDKYVVGDDGLWYKTKWSLYGSVNCPVSELNPFYVRAPSLCGLKSFRRLRVCQQQITTSVTQEEETPLLPRPHLLMTLTSRPYQPVGLPLKSILLPAVVPPSFLPYPWPLR
jgi:hypothetical protein